MARLHVDAAISATGFHLSAAPHPLERALPRAAG
jgi:hypothetical protein